LLAALRCACQETVALNCRLQQAALRRIVIDDQDRLAHVKPTMFRRVSLTETLIDDGTIRMRRSGRVKMAQ
jgi:hypothetical protein